MHALLGAKVGVVGNKRARAGLCQARLHHRVATLHDVQTRLFGKLRCTPVQGQAALGQGAQGVQSGERSCQPGQCGHMWLQGVQQLLIKPLLARQGTLLGAQGFVFKGFELGGDETLGIFERLSAPVVLWHLVELTLRHLNEKPVHPVELHPQIGNAGTCLFTHLQVQ